MSNQTVGLILSLPNWMIDRILHGRTVYVGPGISGPDLLKSGDRIFFHDSDRSDNFLIAEARITKAAWARRDEVLRYEPKKLFLSKDELGEYLARINHKVDDHLVVLELEEATEYMKPVKCPFSIPAEGVYLTQATFGEILRVNT